MIRTTRTICFLLAVFFAPLCPLPLHANAQVVNGTISGTVTDPSGAVIANANVVVHNDDTGVQRTLTTSGSGTFTAPAIPIGSYTISVDASGFASLQAHRHHAHRRPNPQPDLVCQDHRQRNRHRAGRSRSRQSFLRPDLRPGRRAPGQGTSAERTQLRPVASAESRHGELHQPAFRQHWNFELLGGQHVLRLRPAPAGQSLPAQWH